MYDEEFSDGLDIFLKKTINIRSTEKIKNIKKICKSNNDIIFFKHKEIKKFLTKDQLKRIEKAKYLILEFFLNNFSKNFHVENSFF